MIKISQNIPFLIAKAHANYSKSPTNQQINSMILAETISDVENILASTSYGKLLEGSRPSIDLSQFEVAMRKQYAELLSLYHRAGKGNVEKLLEAYVLMIEAENISIILKAILMNTVDKELEQVIIPVGEFGMRHYRRMLENTDPMVTTDFITYPRLKKVAQRALDSSDDPDIQSFLLSSGLSHAAFSQIAEVAPDWIKLEVDFLNLETICRAIKLEIEPSRIESWLIPDLGTVYRHRSRLSNFDNPRDVIQAIQSSFPVSRPLKTALDAEEPVVTLEDEALKYLAYRRKRMFALFGNRTEAILDYFSIKRAEIEDISRILLAKTRNIPPEQIRERVYPIYR